MNEAKQTEQDLKALEAFIVDNPDLERLEALLDQFNIFEAIGVARQELRHSDFLAFLLDPQENHRLGDAFIKRLLQRVLMSVPDVSKPVTPIELSLWDLSRMEVQREWHHIDIFLLDERNQLAIIVENKVDTGEHSDQLQRYYETVQGHYPGYKTVSLYLSPTGDEPSHEAYLPLSYGLVCETLDSLADSQLSILNNDLRILITHYTEMLRRHIVGDSEIARLSQQIYRKHQRAIDLIFEHRPDIKAEIKTIVDDLVGSEADLMLTEEEQGVRKISFVVRAWDAPLLMSSKHSKDERILSFQLWNYPQSLRVVLFVKPGPQEIRQKLFEIVEANPDVLSFSRSWGDWTLIFTRNLLGKEMYEGTTSEDREAEIHKNWNAFLEEDLPRMDAALKRESWIWQEPGEFE